MKNEIKLTAKNYYSQEADREYFSCSQYEDFCRCEARTVAKYEGRWEEKPTEALLVGNYFHTAMESPEAHAAFIEEHREQIYTRGGKLRAAFLKAEDMIETALADPFITEWINRPGEREKIMTGKLFGEYPWKIRLDKYFEHDKKPIIVDWKTVSDIYRQDWSEEARERQSFIRSYGYLMRAAVYLEIERQAAERDTDAEFFIVAISKQDPPDKAIINLTGGDRQDLDYELAKIREKIWHFQMVKEGVHAPKRCGHCEYCRSTKRLGISEIMHYTELDPGNIREQEDEYDFTPKA